MIDSAWPRIIVTAEVGQERDLASAVLLAEIAARGYRARETGRWDTSQDSTDDIRAAGTQRLYESYEGHEETLVLGWGPCVLSLVIWRSRHGITHVTLDVAGLDIASVRDVFDQFKQFLPVAEGDADDEGFAVRFWMDDPRRGPLSMTRRLRGPRWDQIAANYPPRTRAELAFAMEDLDAVAERGRVLLWHGPPGTGKTYALRALARQHAKVASIDYVLEPELFFGKGATDLVHLLEDDDGNDEERWRVLVLEDCDELISIDAKERAGQGMSRLLNLADGFFGQALRALIVITTNEPLTTFHPAITRPGRCGSLVTFYRFGAEEGEAWLQARGGGQLPVGGAFTLAELFALTAGQVPQPSRRQVGFRPESGHREPPTTARRRTARIRSRSFVD